MLRLTIMCAVMSYRFVPECFIHIFAGSNASLFLQLALMQPEEDDGRDDEHMQ
jgi:hypothetical protein